MEKYLKLYGYLFKVTNQFSTVSTVSFCKEHVNSLCKQYCLLIEKIAEEIELFKQVTGRKVEYGK